MVVAESRYRAEDAIDTIEIDIEPLPPVLDRERALDADAPIVHTGAPSNLYGEIPAQANPELDAVLASAPVVLTETFHQHRYATVPMETRGIVARWEPGPDELTIWISTQGPHGVRSLAAADARDRRQPGAGDHARRRWRVRLEDEPAPGGARGRLATHLLGRPVKWIQDRRENLLVDDHARDDQATVTMAADEDGKILAAKVDFLEGAGAFPAAFASATVFSTTMLFPGPYRFAAFGASARTVLTNTAGRGSYRGPWMFETVAREQMMDCLAARLGIDPLELRRRNVIGEADMPYTMAGGFVYDQMTAADNARAGRRDDRVRRAPRAAARVARRRTPGGDRHQPPRRADRDGVHGFMSDRRRHRAHRAERACRRLHQRGEPRAEPRDDDRAGRCRRARPRHRAGARRAGRHRRDAGRSRHRRQSERRRPDERGPYRGPGGARSHGRDRGAPARGFTRRPRDRRWSGAGGRHADQGDDDDRGRGEGVHRAGQPAARRATRARGAGPLHARRVLPPGRTRATSAWSRSTRRRAPSRSCATS